MKYFKSDDGLFLEGISPAIPDDATEITEAEYLAIISFAIEDSSGLLDGGSADEIVKDHPV